MHILLFRYVTQRVTRNKARVIFGDQNDTKDPVEFALMINLI